MTREAFTYWGGINFTSKSFEINQSKRIWGLLLGMRVIMPHLFCWLVEMNMMFSQWTSKTTNNKSFTCYAMKNVTVKHPGYLCRPILMKTIREISMHIKLSRRSTAVVWKNLDGQHGSYSASKSKTLKLMALIKLC